MNSFKHIFKQRGGITLNKVKGEFQKLYKGFQNDEGAYDYHLFETFWQNEELRRSLWLEKTEIQAKIDFIAKAANTTSSIYSFIEIR